MRAVPSGRWCVTWQQRECVCVCHEILFEEPNPTGSRPRGLIGHYRQRKPRRRGRKRRIERRRRTQRKGTAGEGESEGVS